MWIRALGLTASLAAPATAEEALLERLDSCLEPRIEAETEWTQAENLVRLSGCAAETGAVAACAPYDMVSLCVRREGRKLDPAHGEAVNRAELLTDSRGVAWQLYMLDRNREHFLSGCVDQMASTGLRPSRAAGACDLIRKSAELAIARGLWIAEGRP